MVKPANDRPLADFVQRFFDQFCWADGSVDARTVAEKSKSMKIRIFHNQEYYDETGATVWMYQGRQTADLKAFVNGWKEMAKHRDSVCSKMFTKEELEKAVEARKEALLASAAKIKEARIQVAEKSKEIAACMANIARMENQMEKYFFQSEKHKASIRVLTKRKELLEARNFQPKFEVPELENVPLKIIPNHIFDSLM